MRRFMFLSIGVLCFAASMLSTSPSEAKPVKSAIGLQGGVNLSGFESGRIGSIAPDYRWRGIVGLYGRIGFHEKAAIQLECLYSQKGGQGEIGNKGLPVTIRYTGYLAHIPNEGDPIYS